MFRLPTQFNFLAQTVLLSPRQVNELKWARTVNTSGRRGKNIPVDLHMEHLNRRLKVMLRNLGSNIMPSTAKRAARVLGVVEKICAQFKAETSITQNKDFHSVPSIKIYHIYQSNLLIVKYSKSLITNNTMYVKTIKHF